MKTFVALAIAFFCCPKVIGRDLPQQLQARSVSECHNLINIVKSIHVTSTSITRSKLTYPGPICTGEPTIETNTYQIEEIVSTKDPTGTSEIVYVSNKVSRWEVHLRRSGPVYDVRAYPLVEGSKPDSHVGWSVYGFVWDGQSSLISRHLTNRPIIGEKCFVSDAYGQDFNSYRIEINIAPSYIFAKKIWFEKSGCKGTNSSGNDLVAMKVVSAGPVEEKEIVTLGSGDRLTIEQTDDKWVLSGYDILEGTYFESEMEQPKVGQSISQSLDDWKTVDPLDPASLP